MYKYTSELRADELGINWTKLTRWLLRYVPLRDFMEKIDQKKID
jgi:hypothetical protein